MVSIKSPIEGIRGIFPTIEMRTAATGPVMKVADKDAAAFQTALQRDPASALAGMGIKITPAESRRLAEQIRALTARGGGSREASLQANGSVEVSTKWTFGKG
jgi:hypothetical protein